MKKRTLFFSLLLCFSIVITAQNSFGKIKYLTGRMLVAAPKLKDPYFKFAVVYLIKHDARGAVGLIVNRKVGVGSFAEMLADLGRSTDQDRQIDLYFGGPVSHRKVFELHSSDFSARGTLTSSAGISMTGSISIIDAIADGNAPRQMRFMMGYAGWAAGQLEKEIERGDWLHAAADEAHIFGFLDQTEEIWLKAYKKAGLTL